MRALLPLALAGCSLLDAEPPPEPTDRTGLVTSGGRPTRSLVPFDRLTGDAPHLVALVVLDTVRADRTSLCGHDRPTTPTLVRLASEASAWTCDAYAPAPWTLPSHATYFTGLPTSVHDVHVPGVSLADEHHTLAEHFADRGYQTLFVSANPTFGAEATGFWQGFDRVVVAEGAQGVLRDDLRPVLRKELARLDPSAPLFVVINLFDAHDPYPAVPKGIGWAAPQPAVFLHPSSDAPDNPYLRFVTGTMPDAEVGPWLHTVRTAYDHGLSVADRNLGWTLEVLGRAGRLDGPVRIAITSDHGEHLGEHGLLRHGSATYEPVTRVPLLWRDTTGVPAPTLPSPVSAAVVHRLLTTGRLPDPLPTVTASSVHNPADHKPSFTTTSLWGPEGAKQTEQDGAVVAYDLAADPGELAPTPVAAGDGAEVRTLAEAHAASIARGRDRGTEDEVVELLEAVGYVQ